MRIESPAAPAPPAPSLPPPPAAAGFNVRVTQVHLRLPQALQVCVCVPGLMNENYKDASPRLDRSVK